VSAIDYPLAGRDFVHAVHENRAFALKLLNHKAVVDDFLADVNWRSEGFQGDADDVNGPHHSGAESPGFEQK